MRSDGTPALALKQKGRFRTLDRLQVKEAIVGGDSQARRRFVIVRNPAEAKRDQQTREDIVQTVTRTAPGTPGGCPGNPTAQPPVHSEAMPPTAGISARPHQ